jgi:hypothetical protein
MSVQDTPAASRAAASSRIAPRGERRDEAAPSSLVGDRAQRAFILVSRPSLEGKAYQESPEVGEQENPAPGGRKQKAGGSRQGAGGGTQCEMGDGKCGITVDERRTKVQRSKMCGADGTEGRTGNPHIRAVVGWCRNIVPASEPSRREVGTALTRFAAHAYSARSVHFSVLPIIRAVQGS